MTFEEETAERFRRMMEQGVFLDPLLIHTWSNVGESELVEKAATLANTLYDSHVSLEEMSMTLGDVPFSPWLAHRCFHETLLSTAVWVAHERTGDIRPTDAELEEACARVERFILEVGATDLYRLYFVVAGYDLLLPIHFHKSIRETDYLHGVRHYPYNAQTLDPYLFIAMAMGSIRLKNTQQGRVIQLTRKGVQQFQESQGALEQSGYLDRRITMSYLYQFDTVEDWDKLCDVVWPDATELRRMFVEWVDLPADANVLEVACGTGALTFDAGLAQWLHRGQLTATDISSGMLEQAEEKLVAAGSPAHVRLQHASAERLPFPDASFDACIGCAFLHFTDAAQSVAEMARMVRPGGTVAVLQGLQFDLQRPFFSAWFEPIFELAKRRNAKAPANYLPDPAVLKSWFIQAGLHDIEMEQTSSHWVFDHPEIVVQHIVRGVSFFQSELVYLPWDDQRSLIMELVDRGRDVCRQFPLAERIIVLPTVLVRGTTAK